MQSLLASYEMNEKSPCFPLVQNAAPLSCIYFCCSRPRHIWPNRRLNILMWFVVTHFGSLRIQFFAVRQTNQTIGKSCKFKNSSTDLDQGKLTIGVKITPKSLISILYQSYVMVGEFFKYCSSSVNLTIYMT